LVKVDKQTQSYLKLLSSPIKKLKGNAIPSQFSWGMAPLPSSEERGETAVRRSRKRLLEDIEQEESIIFLESEDIPVITGNFKEVSVHEESVSVD
jgi:hypothetical protein